MNDEFIDTSTAELSAIELSPDFEAAASAAWAVPETADEYRFALSHLTGSTPEEIMAGTAAFKTAAHRMGLPVSLARHIAESISDGIKRRGAEPVDRAALAAGATKSLEILERTYGVAEADRMLHDTAALLDLAATPELEELLERSGATNDPFLIATLSNVYRVRAGR